MPEIRANTLSLVADGREIQIKTPTKRNLQLNVALQNPGGFQEFARDPAAFAHRFDLEIDPAISARLADSLRDIPDLDTADRVLGRPGPETVGATLWAVAQGAYSVSSSKVAVAF